MTQAGMRAGGEFFAGCHDEAPLLLATMVAGMAALHLFKLMF